LRNAIDWSYRLLSADEATLLSRLSVFAGGWSIDAVEAVCAPLDEIDTADGLGRLLDHNLIQVQDCAAGSRFALLDTIHHYARTKLDARPDEAHVVCRRHAEFFVALAVRANAEILGPNRGTWLRRLQEELANIRIALAWLRDNGRLDDALQLAGSLQWFWFDGTHWREGRDWLEALLAASPPSARTVGRATALVAAGGCRRGLNEFQAADRLLRDGIEIWRELGDRKELGRALLELSVVANATGDAAAARALTEEGLTCAREGGDGPYIGLALYALGLFTLGDGDQAGAEQQFRAALTAWHDSGSNGLAALGWNALGDLARVQARYSDAADYYRTSLTASDATRQLQAIFRHNLGQALTRLGETAQARALFTDALTRFRELRDVRGVAECVAGLAETLPATAAVPAVEAFAAAMRAIDDLGSHPSPSNHAEYQVFLDTACRSLGEAGIAAATARGRHLTLEQAEALVRRHCVATPTE
jgi:tetratricopeptide (TPR) repeat protein